MKESTPINIRNFARTAMVSQSFFMYSYVYIVSLADSKVSLPSISLGRNDGSNEREQRAKNLYLLMGKN